MELNKSRIIKVSIFFAIILIFGSVMGCAMKRAEKVKADEGVKLSDDYKDSGKAVLAGGCFWGIEAVFENLNGVVDVVSGYSGGEEKTAKYKIVGTGKTNHAEAVEIIYDPELLSYETILEVFFKVAHDPTELNFQGPDVGTEYRSVIFYADNDQKVMAQQVIKKLEEKKVYKNPIVTELTLLDEFYPAEEYHQDFMRLNPDHPYILHWDAPKIRKLWSLYPELVKK